MQNPVIASHLNRFGKFYVKAELCLEENLIPTREMFKQLQFIPIRVEFLYHRNEFELIGSSPMFNKITENQLIPKYEIIITKLPNDALKVSVQEHPNVKH